MNSFECSSVSPRLPCESYLSSRSACLQSCSLCVFNLTGNACLTLTRCPLPQQFTLLLNPSAQANCSHPISSDDSSGSSADDPAFCSPAFILPIIYLCIFSVCCFCAAPYRWQSRILRRMVLFLSVPSWLGFVAISFLYHGSYLSCTAFVALMLLLLAMLFPAGCTACGVVCGAEERMEKWKLDRMMRQGAEEERKKKEAKRKEMKIMFATNPFVEKYVLRLILEYEGRFLQEELDSFAHIKHSEGSEDDDSNGNGDGGDEKSGEVLDGEEDRPLAISVDPIGAPAHVHAAPQGMSTVVMVTPLSPSELEMEVRFHFPELVDVELDD